MISNKLEEQLQQCKSAIIRLQRTNQRYRWGLLALVALFFVAFATGAANQRGRDVSPRPHNRVRTKRLEIVNSKNKVVCLISTLQLEDESETAYIQTTKDEKPEFTTLGGTMFANALAIQKSGSNVIVRIGEGVTKEGIRFGRIGTFTENEKPLVDISATDELRGSVTTYDAKPEP